MEMLDRELLAEFLEKLCDKYYGHEIVEILEDAGILDVHDVVAYLEDYIIEGKGKFEL